MRRKPVPGRPRHIRSTRAKKAAITHIPVPHSSWSATHFSDRPALVAAIGLPHDRGEKLLRGYPETFSHCRSEIKQPPCGNETQGDCRERVYSAYDEYDCFGA